MALLCSGVPCPALPVPKTGESSTEEKEPLPEPEFKNGLIGVENAALVLATATVHKSGRWLLDAVRGFILRNRHAVQATDGGRLLRERQPLLADELFGKEKKRTSPPSSAAHSLNQMPRGKDKDNFGKKGWKKGWMKR